MRTRVLIGVGVMGVVAAAMALVVIRRGDDPAATRPTVAKPPATAPAPPLSIGLWGDIPYTAADQARVPETIDSMNAAGLDFSVFDGDIKGGGPCEDRVYSEAITRFDTLEAPAVYVPGDNEWTDCRDQGSDVGLERLEHLRQVMFARPDSFGRRTMALEHQSSEYPENTRWQMGGVVFATVHVVGSNNNRANPSEATARDEANRTWLHDSFDQAVRTDAAGVMVITQADPAFGFVTPQDRVTYGVDGLDPFVEALREETIRFARPVALVHGDGHFYTLDHPLLDGNGAPVPNLVRVETFGTPSLSWVLARVDAHDPQVFRFEVRLVG